MVEVLPGGGTTLRVPPTNLRFELIESLRAIAALSVLLHHTGGWSKVNLFTWYGAFTSKLHLGVTLFFLISGFLLYRPHAVQMLGGRAASPAGDYALRRAFRILPAYWVALTVLSLWPGLRGVFTKDWWVYYGLLQSYRPEWSLQGIAVAWSLSVEIAFYALLPLVAVVLSRAGRRLGLRGRLRLQLLAFAALAVGGLLFRAAIHDARAWGLTLPANSLGFLVGMSTAVVSAWSERRESEWRATRWITAHSGWCWVLAAVLFSAISLSPAFPRPFSDVPQSTFSYTAESLIGTAIAFLVMLPAVFGEHAGGLPRRVLRSRILSWIGKISYGVFLWHGSLLGVLRPLYLRGLTPGPTFLLSMLLIVPSALALGWLSWRWIERPALAFARSMGARGAVEAGPADLRPEREGTA